MVYFIVMGLSVIKKVGLILLYIFKNENLDRIILLNFFVGSIKWNLLLKK